MIDVINLKDEYSPLMIPKKENVIPKPIEKNKSSLASKTTAIAAPFVLTPLTASADTFDDIHITIMNLFDGGVVLVIIFAGAAWALGHRPKAIELLIGVCCGYLLARHAVDIRDYLKSIGN